MSEAYRTILIVDDETFIRQSFADFFEDQLWHILEAESGEQGLEILENESPQAAIVDIRLGRMDGNAFIREASRRKPEISFVICTGSPEYDIPEDILNLPSVSPHIFRKPVTDMAELEKALLELIRNKKV